LRPAIRYSTTATTNAATVRIATFAKKKERASSPETQAASRIVHIDRTGYSSHSPRAERSHGSR
jgi:hypothetical protein